MRKIAILGAAESGIGTAILAKKQGMDVWLSDRGEIKPKYLKMLDQHNIAYEQGKHSEQRILSAEMVVKSPGIPDTAPIVQQLIAQGTPILSELEFARPFSKGRTVCITGSNGKTTTTSLIYHIMKHSGLDVGLAGNIGHSYALQVATGDHDWYVLEISSFQLDNMFDFRADIAVLMNITPDHLDRYDFQMQHYTDSKMRILQNQRPQDYFIYWAKDQFIAEELEKRAQGYAPQPTPSSRPAQPGHPTCCPFEDEEYEQLQLHFSQMGQHNKRNALAAYHATRLAGVSQKVIRECLSTFPGVEHRLERVAEKAGVLYINDSKATNVDACAVALNAMDRPTILIVGGLDKGNDYTSLHTLVTQKCRAIVFLGADNSVPRTAFEPLGLPMSDTHNMRDCIQACQQLAQKGDAVLLSPCCASFDLFKNMEDRGAQFKQLVDEITD